MRKKAEQRGLEKEEEDYFNEDRFIIVSVLVIDSFIIFAYMLVMLLIRYSTVLLFSEVNAVNLHCM